MTCAIGIDLGGTNVKGLAVTIDGEVLARRAVRTRDGVDDWRETAKRLVRALEEKTVGPRGHAAFVGVAAPGLAAKDHLSIAHMPGRLQGLEGLNWTAQLGRRKPVPVCNDAHAALLGESWLGAAMGASNAILLTLGTGVGGAAIVDGHLLQGTLGRAGHFGHVSLDPNGQLDITGTPGSLEDTIGECTLHARTNGRFTCTRDLVRAVRSGDKQATAVWDASIKGLAAALAGLINVLDPEVVVLGGGISRAGRELFRRLEGYMSHFEWRPAGRRARVVRARLGEWAGAYGAVWNALEFKQK